MIKQYCALFQQTVPSHPLPYITMAATASPLRYDGWDYGLFSCCDVASNPGTCFLGTFAPWCLYGMTVGADDAGACVLHTGGFMCCWWCFPLCASVCFPWMATSSADPVRDPYKLNPKDPTRISSLCMESLFCGNCAIGRAYLQTLKTRRRLREKRITASQGIAYAPLRENFME